MVFGFTDRGGRVLHGVFAALLAVLAATPALAEHGSTPGSGLGELLFGKSQPQDRAGAVPRLARFRADTGDTFVFEVADGGPAFLKYDDSGEVWALSPTAGPRGDTIYKNDTGEAMLRTTRMGGLTVFTRERPAGIAAAIEGGAADLHNLLVAGPIALYQVLLRASTRASLSAGHTVPFEALDTTTGTEPVFADAASLTAQAFLRVQHRGPAGQSALRRCAKVAFVNGRPPGVAMVGPELRITVTPDLGFAGRPSSQRISQVLFRR
jgi:hypothetical protein